MRWIATLFKPFAWLVAHSPRQVRFLLAWLVAFIWWDVLRIRRRVVLENLERAFPDWSEKRRRKVGRKSLFHMGLTLTEFCLFPFFNKEWLPRWMSFEGLEHLDQALAEKKGVLILTLHLGNGDLALMGLSYKGYPMHLISKRFKTQWLDKLWFDLRERHGTMFIDPRRSSFDILKALKRQQMVVFVMDQFMGPPLGIPTTFFGHKTGTALGLALMAERTQAPVVPAFSYRKPDGSLVVNFLPSLPLEQGEGKDETYLRNTQRYNDVLQGLVEQFPEQWMWLHKRWKPFKE